ncbi:sodium/nucleoside cotransporter [Holotrichia oblita]|uniref:Sodium/nucleoside cotransporter n=1 Tax=Holotrichia oblita TaxID=644536 RepID=A0ACB9SJ43_HOLOL|nr:sodium/nucleoside cotransporter [Holotrichia oblita]
MELGRYNPGYHENDESHGNNQHSKLDEAYNLQQDEPVNNGDINTAKKESSFFLSKALQRSQDSIGSFLEDNSRNLGIGLKATVFLMFTAHFIWATYYFIDQTDETINNTMCHGYGFLLLLYIAITYGFTYTWCLKPYVIKPIGSIANIVGHLLILAAALTYLVIDARDEWNRLIPLIGFTTFIIFGFLCSKYPGNIIWRPVIWGFISQFVFGLLTVRWKVGRDVFRCAGDKVTTFLGYAVNGSAFVYGDILVHQYQIFAFQAVSTIYFLNFFINVLYYYGIMQKIVGVLGSFLHSILGTTICESVNTAGNIFLGQSEAPFLLKPYLKNLTSSEFHTIIASGFATVSGTVLAAYISYGAKAEHLITATVMAAPTALAYSKLMYPETEEIKNTKKSISLVESDFKSVLDAASKGASEATMIVFNIIANLIAFIAFIYFVNGILGWMGQLCGYMNEDELWSVEEIMGYILTPIAFIMGVPWDECHIVGRLIGVKMMVNEFAAFAQFSELKELLTARTQVITTYAIVGFGNPGSIGLMVSALSTLVPEKSHVVTAVVFRAYVCGTIICLLTASMAALLIPEDLLDI